MQTLVSDIDVRLYRPELIPRRGEFIAWVSAGLLGLTVIILYLTHQRVSWVILGLLMFFLLSAVVISLGNWMDRQTLIRIGPDAIEYHNGLRRVRLTWGEVLEVRVTPGAWGMRFQVRGVQAYFIFHTLGEVRHKGELKGRMGFEAGDEILRQIVLKSNLQIVDDAGGGYYYARQ